MILPLSKAIQKPMIWSLLLLIWLNFKHSVLSHVRPAMKLLRRFVYHAMSKVWRLRYICMKGLVWFLALRNTMKILVISFVINVWSHASNATKPQQIVYTAICKPSTSIYSIPKLTPQQGLAYQNVQIKCIQI